MPNIVAELKISMDDAGNISVNGPIDNQLLSYGLLEVAKDVIKQHAAENARKIQPAPLSLVNQFKKPS